MNHITSAATTEYVWRIGMEHKTQDVSQEKYSERTTEHISRGMPLRFSQPASFRA